MSLSIHWKPRRTVNGNDAGDKAITCSGLVSEDAVEEGRHTDASADVGSEAHRRSGGRLDAALAAYKRVTMLTS